MSRIGTDLHFDDCSAEDFEDINRLLELYLDELDSWQREVDNIRIMHHDVWKGSRLSPLIKQHRAGSRVEKQTRILPTGGQTDVDYMFEVTGIEVRCNEHQGPSTLSHAPVKTLEVENPTCVTPMEGFMYVSLTSYF